MHSTTGKQVVNSTSDLGSTERLSRSQGRAFRPSTAILLIPGLLVIGLLFIWPLSQMVIRSFVDPSIGFTNYMRFFQTSSAVRSLVITMRVSFVSTFLCAFIGYIYAFTMALSSRRITRLLMVAIVLPMGVNLLVRTFSLQAILRDTGVINEALLWIGLIQKPLPLIRNQFSVSVGIVSMLLPFIVLPTYNTMIQIDKKLLLASEGLGAPPWRVFIDIFLPLSLPGLMAGCLIVFVSSLGFFVVPALLGSGNEQFFSQTIYFWVRNRGEFGYGAAMGVILLALTMGTLLITSFFVQIDKAISSTTGGK
jgi:putative spermidine/putrescine transport system permease protein